MKLINVVLKMLSMTGLASCIGLNTCPIQMSTSKITFSEHSSSGMLISTTFEIYEDSLVWNRMEPRYGWELRDVSPCDKQDFMGLLTELSAIRFSARDTHDFISANLAQQTGFSEEDYQVTIDKESLPAGVTIEELI